MDASDAADAADRIWDRALKETGLAPRAGDSALKALLAFHGEAMNGGVLHAIGSSSAAELKAARDGYRYFGFDSIAKLIAPPSKDEPDLDLLEERLDDEYYADIPDDEVLVRAVYAHIRSHPEAYAPIDLA